MKVVNYERTYPSVRAALKHTKYLDAVVEVLREQSEPVTCATIGKAVFGSSYDNSRRYPALMGQMLSHLRNGGFVKVEEREGDPCEIEIEAWIPESDIYGETPMIRVHDDKGREYLIDNPNYNKSRSARCGHWGKVKKTIIPTIKLYSWIA